MINKGDAMSVKSVGLTAHLDGKFTVTTTIGPHTLTIDQPQGAGGTGAGPTPLEYFLFSLTGCMSAIARIVANQKGYRYVA